LGSSEWIASPTLEQAKQRSEVEYEYSSSSDGAEIVNFLRGGSEVS
jgi:hypothetical protein